ncbi:MAG: ABC transporter permease [Fretibacterium sp.]|nr:ABC transporter permease [Fretibacterium sp.]
MENGLLGKIGIPRLIISLFLAFLIAAGFAYGLPMGQIFSAMLTRFGMNLLLVLAMIPTIQAGAGPNFGLPFGIICGLVGATLAIELDFRGFPALIFALAVSIPLGALAGWLYGLLLNKVKGQEMTVGTYMGFSIVSLMCIFWLMAPYKSPEMIWPYGGEGLRVTVVLDGRMEQLLDRLMSFTVGSVTIPTGLLLFAALCCLLLWYFMKTSTGLAMSMVGANPRFAEASGLSVNRYRVLASIISCAMGAAGIVIYSQSYGFLQLYQAPLYMALYSVSAILIGGASLQRATITQAVIGTFLFNSLLVIALPVANVAMSSDISEIMRVIISNGIILYALTRKEVGGDAR